MSQVKHESFDDGGIVQFDQPDEVPDQQEAQQQREQPQFGLHQNPFDWGDWPVAVDTGNTRNYDNELKEHKKMIANLEVKNQTLQAKVENLESKAEAENRALKESSEQKENYQALEAKINELTKLLSTQSEQHKQEMEQLESKNRKLEEKLRIVELQTAENGEKDYAVNNEFGMTKGTILGNYKGNGWNGLKTKASISEYGRKATGSKLHWIFATDGYAISGEHCRKEHFPFPGSIVYYFEVTSNKVNKFSVGFTDGSQPAAGPVGSSPNSYGISFYEGCSSFFLSGVKHEFEWPDFSIKDDLGCGLLLNSKNRLAIFFTLNGKLLEQQIPINPTVNRLYPTTLIHTNTKVEANFGNDLIDKRFKFDIENFPGLVFE